MFLLEIPGPGAALPVLMQHKVQVANKNAINLSNSTMKCLNTYLKHSNPESLLNRMSVLPRLGNMRGTEGSRILFLSATSKCGNRMSNS